jgi:hypothetical protein
MGPGRSGLIKTPRSLEQSAGLERYSLRPAKVSLNTRVEVHSTPEIAAELRKTLYGCP